MIKFQLKYKVLSIVFFFYIADGTNNSKDQLTGSLEDLNFLNLPADVR